MNKRAKSPPLYQATQNLPGCGIRRGDVLEIRRGNDRDHFRIVREFGGMLERVRLVEHMEAHPDAFRPVGNAPPVRELLGIRRPPARKWASPPKLHLVK